VLAFSICRLIDCNFLIADLKPRLFLCQLFHCRVAQIPSLDISLRRYKYEENSFFLPRIGK